MKFLFFSILFILTNLNPNPTSDPTLTLARHYKVESTFSGNTEGEKSFHLIIAKNNKTKSYEIIPVEFKNNTLSSYESIHFDKKPSIVSFHNNGNMVSLITSVKAKKHNQFNVIDIDLTSGENFMSENISAEDFKAVIRKPNTNLLVFSNKKEIKIINAVSANSIKTITAIPDKNNKYIFNELKDSSLDAVNKDEFVINGSINKIRAYSEGEELIITHENIKQGSTTVAKIALDKGAQVGVAERVYLVKSNKKSKKSTSFVDGQKLYQLKLNKEAGDINVFDFKTDNQSSLSLEDSQVSKKSKGFTSIEDFLKKSSKSINEPTVSVNKSKSGNVVLRADYVNRNTYNYSYNWWWHHHWMMQQQMWHHQQMMRQAQQNIPKFGPSPEIYDEIAMVTAKADHHYFEIVLTPEVEVVSNSSEETVHKYIDKKKYVEELDKNKSIKHASSLFVGETFRYFAFDNRKNVFKIYHEDLND